MPISLNKNVNKPLTDIIVRFGTSIIDDPRRCEAIIRDMCVKYRTEANLLIMSLKEGVAAEILRASESAPIDIMLARLSEKLQKEHGLHEDSATWVVRAWAIALGRLTVEEKKETENIPVINATSSAYVSVYTNDTTRNVKDIPVNFNNEKDHKKKWNRLLLSVISLILLLLLLNYWIHPYNINISFLDLKNVLFGHKLEHLPVMDGTVTDIDGNVYKTVRIGSMTWMAENLKTTRFNDGTKIDEIINNKKWETCKTPAYCWYDNDKDKRTYGALYNWYAAHHNKLAPKGWHVASHKEWQELHNFLITNGYNWDNTTSESRVAKALAAKGGWNWSILRGNIGNDIIHNNKSGFSAIPGGSRTTEGDFYGLGKKGCWWSSTSYYTGTARSWLLSYDGEWLLCNSGDRKRGKSIRCIKGSRPGGINDITGDLDDILGGLFGGGGGSGHNLKKRGSLKIKAPQFIKGTRSKASIMRVVMQYLAVFRYAYNKRLRDKPGLKGKITVKFAIDEFGKVIFCQVVNSTMGDSQFETTVVDKIRRWKFDKNDKQGDVTEVVYPFVFSQ